MSERKGRVDGRVGVSLSSDCVLVLDEVRGKMLKELGFSPSYSQTIQYLCVEAKRQEITTQTDNPVEVFQDRGE